MLVSESQDLQIKLSSILPKSLQLNTIVKHPKSVRVQNTTYKNGMFVLIKSDRIDPLFGEIIEITIVEKVIVFYVVLYKTAYFDTHFNSFVIYPIMLCGYQRSPNYNSLLLHKSFDKTNPNLYVSLPYYICDN